MRNIEKQKEQAKKIIRKHQGLDITVRETKSFMEKFMENSKKMWSS